MRTDAIVAVIIATLCMLVYIWFRFKDIRFATSAVIALVHDVLVVLAFYVIARVSVGNTFIACMLTIVGYSINATIVIFDRIREELKEAGKDVDLKELVNRCITQTLTRSIYTNLTTFIMVVALFILGVSSIREFAAPLMVGIGCGAYNIRLHNRSALVCNENENRRRSKSCRKSSSASGGGKRFSEGSHSEQ